MLLEHFNFIRNFYLNFPPDNRVIQFESTRLLGRENRQKSLLLWRRISRFDRTSSRPREIGFPRSDRFRFLDCCVNFVMCAINNWITRALNIILSRKIKIGLPLGADKIGKVQEDVIRVRRNTRPCNCVGETSYRQHAGLSLFHPTPLFTIGCSASESKQLFWCRRGPIDYANLYFIIEHVISSINKYDACYIIFSAG